MSFDVGTISEVLRQFLAAILAAFGVNTEAGQGIMKLVDFFELKMLFFKNIFDWIGSLFGGLAG